MNLLFCCSGLSLLEQGGAHTKGQYVVGSHRLHELGQLECGSAPCQRDDSLQSLQASGRSEGLLEVPRDISQGGPQRKRDGRGGLGFAEFTLGPTGTAAGQLTCVSP